MESARLIHRPSCSDDTQMQSPGSSMHPSHALRMHCKAARPNRSAASVAQRCKARQAAGGHTQLQGQRRWRTLDETWRCMDHNPASLHPAASWQISIPLKRVEKRLRVVSCRLIHGLHSINWIPQLFWFLQHVDGTKCSSCDARRKREKERESERGARTPRCCTCDRTKLRGRLLSHASGQSTR